MSQTLRPLDRYLAAPMFGVTLLFLLLLAVTLHLGEEDVENPAVVWATWGMLALYPLFVIEAVAQWMSGSRFWVQNVLFCLAPPLRLGARDHETGRWMWLPVWGWSEVGRPLRERLERVLNIPMIVIALAVLPLIAAEPHQGGGTSRIPCCSIHDRIDFPWFISSDSARHCRSLVAALMGPVSAPASTM